MFLNFINSFNDRLVLTAESVWCSPSPPFNRMFAGKNLPATAAFALICAGAAGGAIDFDC
ncbi:MAG TPA: hypothetical protein VNI84_04975 [Pyrinomonadaceae bacterium]|nr:hypothetical protein [Pyrinomonadaceae bacterium]